MQVQNKALRFSRQDYFMHAQRDARGRKKEGEFLQTPPPLY